MRWVGALEVVGPTNDQKVIWSESGFPVRVAVRPSLLLEAEHGVPMAELRGKVSFFRGSQDAGKYRGIVRKSPSLMEREDGAVIHTLLRQEKREPAPVDQRKLYRKLFAATQRRGKADKPVQVSVPDEPTEAAQDETEVEASEHTRAQHLLLTLGREMGFEVWVARNDRSRECTGTTLGQLPGMLQEIPTQFNDATTRTIELIDVLWLKGNSIEAAFEVECTTSIYSGLLRMSDLISLQPNLSIKLYLVAPICQLKR
jgi:hypothetical protein